MARTHHMTNSRVPTANSLNMANNRIPTTASSLNMGSNLNMANNRVPTASNLNMGSSLNMDSLNMDSLNMDSNKVSLVVVFRLEVVVSPVLKAAVAVATMVWLLSQKLAAMAMKSLQRSKSK